ncbi:MAG: MBL fold metallo-hydrolase [Dehalococcoidales bacterium]|nr:MBL fold metallo-hydrolase [Dehalococcoidales bacterium]
MKITDNLYYYPEMGTLDCNVYVVRGKPGIIIDPGARFFLNKRVQQMREDGIMPVDIGVIANTHLHGDHCGANEAFKEISGARILLHRSQQQFYKVAVVETARFFRLPAIEFTPDGAFDDGRIITSKIDFELIHCPGHSPESVCYYSAEEKVLISGDVLFRGNLGRWDLPGGDIDQLIETINKLAQLDIEYLLPGHMEIVAGKEKVQQNFQDIQDILKGL